MKTVLRCLIVPVVLTTFACKGGNANAAQLTADSLSATTDSISAIERTKAASQTATQRRHAYTPPGTSRSSTPATQTPATHVVKHTARDAAIGAGAGAILGAATSKDKVKGGIIGGAAGGILGGVIGNNVDKQTVPNP